MASTPLLVENSQHATSGRLDVTWHDEQVPDSFCAFTWRGFRVYDDVAARVASEDEFGYGISYMADQVAVSAWRYVFLGVVLEWCLVMAFLVLGSTTATCRDDEAVLLWWLPHVAFSVCCVGTWLEVQAGRFLLPVICKETGGLELFGMAVPFTLFYAGTLVLSLISRFNLVMSGLTTVALLQSCRCPNNDIEQIWELLISHSMMPWLPQLSVLGASTWCMLFLQPATASLRGIPYKDQDDLEYNQEKHTLSGLLRTNFVWSGTEVKPAFYAVTGEVGVYQATIALADASRMTLLTFAHTDFYISSNNSWLPDPTSGSRHQWVAEMVRVTQNMSITSFTAVLQMNLQASMLAIGKARNGKMSALVVLTIVCGCILALYSIAKSTMQVCQMTAKVWPTFFTGFDKYAEKEFADDSEYVLRDTTREYQARRHVVASVIVAVAISVGTCLGILYIGLKSMMVLACHDGLWNLGTGCIQRNVMSH